MISYSLNTFQFKDTDFCFKVHFSCFQSTSEVGSAGLYLEDYFEEQLKLIYPDRVFPGGREEQMIPPLEDEIDDEEEQIPQESSTKPQSPPGKESPPADYLDPLEEEAAAPAASEKSEAEKAETSEKEPGEAAAAAEKRSPSAEEDKQEEAAPVKPVEDGAAADGQTEDRVATGSPEEENLQPPAGQTADPPETQEKSAPADAAVGEEG